MTICDHHDIPASCRTCGRHIARARQGGWMHDPMIDARSPEGHPVEPVHRVAHDHMMEVQIIPCVEP